AGEAEEPGEEAERRARGCRPQYQRTPVRFLAHFVAHPRDGGRHLSYLPGPEWLLDVTHLVGGRARVQDPRVASLEGGTVVVGREPGVTSVEVGLGHVIWGGMGLEGGPGGDRGVPGCSGMPRAPVPSPASWQEATLSVWLSFSDGTLAPLELYGWQDAALAVASLDPAVVTVL
ncbi:T132A protein, partial [Chauna torquata]|nr:T132A protein [Chauna torquata]